MRLEIEELKLRNFKGIKELTLEPHGKSLSIYGDNRVGKTTVADAWFWCLFGKDSLNSATFDIKTRVNGEVQHGLDHEVAVVLNLDGEPLVLPCFSRSLEWER